MKLKFSAMFGAVGVMFMLLPTVAHAQAPQTDAPPNTSAPQVPPPTLDSASQNAPPPQSQEQPAPQEQTAPREEGTPGGQTVAPQHELPAVNSKQQASEKKTSLKPKVQTSRRKGKKRVATTAKTPQSGAGAASSPAQPEKVVVRNGGASEALIQLSPGEAQEQAAHRRENTEQLLATTDENLKRISGRQLTAAEQGTVDQIRSYIRQAKAATDAGDLSRAHTLAFKAHLLSDDLSKR